MSAALTTHDVSYARNTPTITMRLGPRYPIPAATQKDIVSLPLSERKRKRENCKYANFRIQ